MTDSIYTTLREATKYLEDYQRQEPIKAAFEQIHELCKQVRCGSCPFVAKPKAGGCLLADYTPGQWDMERISKAIEQIVKEDE